jgi:hypothetical protein
MTNTTIKLVELIVFLSCLAPSAYSIGFGASSNGVSTQFDVQADESSSISGGFTLDSMTLAPVFSGSHVKKFANTYEYPDSAGNKAILSVDLENAKKVYLAVSPATDSAEASETLSVISADLIKTGAKAVTSEGDTASVNLNIVGGSLDGYVNYANANLINEFGNKTFVAWQSADVISGKTIEAVSQAAYAAEDTSLPPVAQLNSNILVTNGQIDGLYSAAGKNAHFDSWDEGYYRFDSLNELYANQSTGAIGKITGKGKKPSPVPMNFASETSAIDEVGNAVSLKTSVLGGTVNDYSGEAKARSEAHASSYPDGYYSSSNDDSTSTWQSAGAINANNFETQMLAVDAYRDTSNLTISILDGTITDYQSNVGASSGSYSSADGYSGTDSYAYGGQFAESMDAGDFESHTLATDADGNRADQTTSMLGVSSNRYGIETRTHTSSSYDDGYSGSYKQMDAGQYADDINASVFESKASATDADGNTADQTTSMLDGIFNYYISSANVVSGYYSDPSGDSRAQIQTNTGQSLGAISASDFESHTSVIDKEGNTADQTTSMLSGTSIYYGNSAGMYSNSYSNSYGESSTYTGQYAGAINASDFTTISKASGINGSGSTASLHVTDASLKSLFTQESILKDLEYEIPDIEAYYYADSVSGSLIRAEGSSHDQSGNAANATMQLESTDIADAAIAGYDQESHTTYPLSWYYPATIAWIRATTSATGNGTFSAGATNGTATATLPTTTTLDGTTFANFGRVREGTPVAYFVISNPYMDPWDYNP